MDKIRHHKDGSITVNGKKYVPEPPPLKLYYQGSTSILLKNDQMIKVLLTFRYFPINTSDDRIQELKKQLEGYINDLVSKEFDVI